MSLIEEEPRSRHRLFIGVMLGIVALGGAAAFFLKGEVAKPPARLAQQIVTITVPPPLPPPPPPPPPVNEPPPPPEQEMIAQEPVAEEEPPPEPAPGPEEPPARDLTTALSGDGPNNFGLSRGPGTGGGNGGPGTIGGTGSGRGSKYGRYAAAVQTSIADALRRTPETRSASFSLQARVWPDRAGLITRVQLVGTTGDPATDEALRSRILTGIQLREPPPADMPLPIVLRLNARKP